MLQWRTLSTKARSMIELSSHFRATIACGITSKGIEPKDLDETGVVGVVWSALVSTRSPGTRSNAFVISL